MRNLIGTTVTVMVADLGRSIEFYTETLGLELIERYGEHYAEIQSPGLKMGLHPSDGSVEVGKNISVGFGVTNLDETVDELSAKGLVLKVVDDGWSRLASFTDPDQNPLYLAEIKS